MLRKARKKRPNSYTTVRLDCIAANERLRNYYEDYGFRFVREENNGTVALALYELPLGIA
jgi:hypothetical protein